MLIAGHEKGQGWVRFLHSARLGGNLLTLGQIRHPTLKKNDYYPLIARAVERLDRSTGELAGRFTSERAKPSRNCTPTSPRSWTRISPRSASLLKRRSARWRPKRRASHHLKHGPSRGRRLRRRACPIATKFNPATTGSRLHRTEMIGRRLCPADKRQYSCPPRSVIATTQIFKPSRLAELTAPITITMISRARAGGAVSLS